MSMLASLLLSLLLLLVAATRQTVSQLNITQKQLLLDLHNQARSSASPTATNMERMEWNNELAQVAQAYSERCMFEHNPSRASQAPSFSNVGENLAISSGLGDNYEGLFILWHNERSDYTYSTNQCAIGAVCGHYTQIVWASSDNVGCGATRCATVTGFGGRNALLLVCNYGPAGNYVGQHPYIAGGSCSACPNLKQICSDNLCSNTTGSSTVPADDTGGSGPGVASQSFAFVILVAVASIKITTSLLT